MDALYHFYALATFFINKPIFKSWRRPLKGFNNSSGCLLYGEYINRTLCSIFALTWFQQEWIHDSNDCVVRRAFSTIKFLLWLQLVVSTFPVAGLSHEIWQNYFNSRKLLHQPVRRQTCLWYKSHISVPSKTDSKWLSPRFVLCTLLDYRPLHMHYAECYTWKKLKKLCACMKWIPKAGMLTCSLFFLMSNFKNIHLKNCKKSDQTEEVLLNSI